MQIAVFGGSFDPPHIGHLLSALQLISFGYVDQVWLMPCFTHVWRKKLSSVDHRLAMTKFLENENIKVSTLEIEQKRPVPTIETLKILTKRYPQHQFFWVIGEKGLKELPKWKDYQKLIKNYRFLVVPQSNNRTIEQSDNLVFVSHPLWVATSVSSSIIREMVKKGLSVKGFVPREVAEYIKKHGLYK